MQDHKNLKICIIVNLKNFGYFKQKIRIKNNRHSALDAVSLDISDDTRRLRGKPAMTVEKH